MQPLSAWSPLPHLHPLRHCACEGSGGKAWDLWLVFVCVCVFVIRHGSLSSRLVGRDGVHGEPIDKGVTG